MTFSFLVWHYYLSYICYSSDWTLGHIGELRVHIANNFDDAILWALQVGGCSAKIDQSVFSSQ